MQKRGEGALLHFGGGLVVRGRWSGLDIAVLTKNEWTLERVLVENQSLWHSRRKTIWSKRRKTSSEIITVFFGHTRFFSKRLVHTHEPYIQ